MPVAGRGRRARLRLAEFPYRHFGWPPTNARVRWALIPPSPLLRGYPKIEIAPQATRALVRRYSRHGMTENVISFEVRGAPVAKGRPRIGRLHNSRPIAFTPAATRKFEAVVRLNAQQAMAKRAPLDGPLSVSVLAVLPIPASWSKKKQEAARSGNVRPTSRPDVDNYAKAAIDACNEVIFRDDAQVCDLSVRKVYGDVPMLRVVVEGVRDQDQSAA